MSEPRKFQRYASSQEGKTLNQYKILVDGKVVRLVNFSIGGFYVLSTVPFPESKRVRISVSVKNSSKVDLVGNVVRVTEEGNMWGIALDLKKIYNLDKLRKV